MTFRSACDELKFRCEAERAYEVLDRGVKPKRKVTAMVSQIEPVLDAQSIETITTALVSSVGKRLNKEMAPATKDKGTRKKFNCLAKDGKTKSPFSLCGLHYHSVISGKTEQLELINDYGVAVYNVTTKMIDYPDTVPKDLLPPIKTKV
jgi:hypothetical protein